MNMSPVFKELSGKLMMGDSKYLPEIWETLCTEEEADIVNMLPGTVAEIADKSGNSQGEVGEVLRSMFMKGVVFERVREGKTTYKMPKQIVQFHDANLMWPDAPPELLGLWTRLIKEEFPKLAELAMQASLPSFMRVIPINESIDSKSQVLTFENAEQMIRNAKSIAVTNCVCRKSMKNCDAPLEACIQLDSGAEYTMKREAGRWLDVDEALDILKKSQKARLIHLTGNRADRYTQICNCCDCCCQMIRIEKKVETKGLVAPSRYRSVLNEELCNGCEDCVEVCRMDARFMNDDNIAEIDEDKCVGCGLCAIACTEDAILLEETRPIEHIPS